MLTLTVSPIWTIITGLEYKSLAFNVLDAALCFFVPGYETDVRYMTKVWDGKEHLLQPVQGSNDFTCLTGLLTRIQTMLNQLGVPWEMCNKIPDVSLSPELAGIRGARLPVRPYQVASVMAAFGAKPRRGGILQIATGGGKTRCAAKLAQLMQVRTVFLVNQKDIMYQTMREFEQMLGISIGQVGDGIVNIQPVTVATLQSVARASGECGDNKSEITPEYYAQVQQMMADASLVILDECHSAPSRTARAAVCLATNATAVLGLSASPWRDDGTDILIEAICGPVVYKLSASELIDLGFLVQPTIHIHKLPQPDVLTAAHMRVDRFDKFYRAWVVDDVFRQEYVTQICDEHMEQGDVVIILVKQIEHGTRLAESIPQSVFLHGKLGKRRRAQILDDVANGTTRTLIATSLADQGLDIPIANVIILAGGGKSSTKALQRIGRVLRPAPGKDRATVHDITDAAPIFRRQLQERMKIYKSEPRFLIRSRASVC